MVPLLKLKKNEAFAVDTRLVRGCSIAETVSGYGLYSSVSCRTKKDAADAWENLADGQEAPQGWTKVNPEDVLPNQQVDIEVTSSRYFWLKGLQDEEYIVRF